MIARIAKSSINTKFGLFQEELFYDGQKETIVIIKGEVEGEQDVLCRIHSSCIYGHYFNSVECDCRHQIDQSQEMIEKEGKGIIILMDQEGKGNGHAALMLSKEYKANGKSQAEAYNMAGFQSEARNFSAAAKIIQCLGIRSVKLITDNPLKMKTLKKSGIPITGCVALKR